jgi:glyoxylase-like metal-dependent hydrolase (beta-lactamase superfamily II)
MSEQLVVGAIATNCYIVPLAASRTCAVVDPGADPEVIIARLRRLRLRPVLILLTHGHFDHVGALADLAVAFTDPPPPDIAVHAADADHLGPQALAVHRRDFAFVGAAAYVDGLWRPLPRPTRLVADGDRIGPFTVLHVPGHSPGSVAYYDQEGGRLYSGDTLFSGGVGRTDLPGGDGPRLDRSLQRLLALDGRVRVYPGHGAATTIERERSAR